MTFWTYQNLADVTNGTWLVKPDDLQQQVTGLWHDTREIKPGQAYLAIKGDNFDGHAFLDQAFTAGAAVAIVQNNHQSSIINHQSRPILQVADTVNALQDLARAYRDELKQGGCKVIGIAGSNGKTTTRHLIHHVLTHAGLKGIQSPKSFNNHLGVPLTLLSGKPQDDFIACEIGTNHPGEIDFLSAIVRPDIAVITSIGKEHLEFFHSVRNVAREEAAILNHVVEDGLLAIPPEDWNNYIERLYNREDLMINLDWLIDDSLRRTCKKLNFSSNMFRNAEIAATVSLRMNVPLATVNQSLADFKMPPGRGERIEFSGLTLIHDAYNANPSSVEAAMDEFERDRTFRNVFVFGDMLELGERSAELHGSIGCHITVFRTIDCLITIGPLAEHACKFIETVEPDLLSSGEVEAHAFPHWSDDLPEKIAALLEPGDTVLLKASRGMRLERLIPAIERRFGPPEEE